MESAHISVRDLRVRYGGALVLRGIDFEVRRGEFVAVVGKSGFGKSTLLYALAGFIERDGDVTIPPNIGFVFQSYAVFPWLTVRANVKFGLHGLGRGSTDCVVNRFLDIVGLSGDAAKYPSQLSGGQAQRVALARALAPDPEVILMDEPFGALDFYTRERMQSLLLEIWDRTRKTVVFVTHNIEEALFLADRVIVMGKGTKQGEYVVPFGRPRTEEVRFTPAFVTLRRQILEGMEHTVEQEDGTLKGPI
jgi:NitT/TauT family transport system ATP-binding protein